MQRLMIIYRNILHSRKNSKTRKKAKAAEAECLSNLMFRKKKKETEQLKIQNSLQEGRLLLLA